MSTAYVECPRCGGRALSVATRCPHCAFDFPPRPLHRSAARPNAARNRLLLAVFGVLVFGTVLLNVAVRRKAPAAGPMPPAVTAPAAAPAIDSLPAAAPPPPSARAAAPTPASPAPAAPLPEAHAPAVPGLRRYARTWTNVRAGRGVSTPVNGILEPGAAVLVDSLRRGWYRVLVDGRAMGYVYRTMLEVEPPAHR
ncbi:MAG TPA: hypothetical protein VFG66_04570 [Gemmatimonadales bacterium]|nr:hypothetical protein [Gemmatimonadales bacterium]